MFRRLFGGGHTELVLTDPSDVLETGIEIIVQPPGKKLQNLLLLSGGERALTAIAMLFALLKVRPSPFCVLDEVDAPLDEANVGRFSEVLREFAERSQFVVVTHNRGTMEAADTLYGVTMEEPGVSEARLRPAHRRRRRAGGAGRGEAALPGGAVVCKGEHVDKLFWIIPGRVAGRPGPDLEPWRLESFRDAGIGAVLSVNDGRLCQSAEFEACGLAYACVPLSDVAPPQPGDDEICLSALPKAYAFVQAQLAQGQTVLVHCTAGNDRTGLFLSYFLMHDQGLSASEAIRKSARAAPNRAECRRLA